MATKAETSRDLIASVKNFNAKTRNRSASIRVELSQRSDFFSQLIQKSNNADLAGLDESQSPEKVSYILSSLLKLFFRTKKINGRLLIDQTSLEHA